MLGLRFLDPEPGLGLFERAFDLNSADIKINITPTQRQQFATPHSRSEGEGDDRIEGATTETLQNLLRLFDGNDLDFAHLRPRRFFESRRGAAPKRPLHWQHHV